MIKDKLVKNFHVANNNAVDMHFGKRIRLRRPLPQEQLSVALGITFQQVQKYERGANRVSASRLWDKSQILDVPISYFFEDLTDDVMKSSPRRISRGSDYNVDDDSVRDTMARCETLEIVRTYYSTTQPKVRKRIAEMVKSIAVTINES
ncbi:helix-turn-helix transcriptional regulator [Alphaproteobacteria bacterium]|nr:helix-turn-helix transcriptional regulator [Alphaproteobacteria bacterium]